MKKKKKQLRQIEVCKHCESYFSWMKMHRCRKDIMEDMMLLSNKMFETKPIVDDCSLVLEYMVMNQKDEKKS